MAVVPQKGLRTRNQDLRTSAPLLGKTLVWIDDYEPGLAAYKAVFQALGYRVLTASDGRRGLHLLQRHVADAVILDYEMPEMDGEAVALEVRRRSPKLPIVMFSGSTSVPPRVKHLVNAFCNKTGSPEQLLSAIENAVQRPSRVLSY